MDDNSYSIEDILLELEVKRSMEEQRPKPPKSAAQKFAANPAKPTEPMSQSEPPKAPVASAPVTPRPVIELNPTATSSAPKPVKPKVSQNTVSISTRTRVLTVESKEDAERTTELNMDDPRLEGQMMMEDFAATPEEDEREHEVRRHRRSKVDAFRLIEGAKDPLKLVGEEEDTEEDTIRNDEDADEELTDFCDYDEAESIQSELNYRRRTGAMTVITSGVMTAMLTLLTLMYEWGWLTTLPAALITAVHTAILIGLLFVNHRLMARGLKTLVTFRADADSAPAVCGLLGLLYTVAQFFYLSAVSAGSALFLSAVAAFGVMGGALGRQMQIMRISRNFKFIGVKRHRKMAAHYLQDTKIATEMGQNIDENGFPATLFYRRAVLLENFLRNSYAADPGDRVMRWYVWVVLGVSLMCGGGYALLFPEYASRAPIVFTVAALLSLPSFMMFATQRSLTRTCKRALKKNVFIAGWEAAEQFGERTDLVVVEASELFPKGCVKLHGIKTFSGTRIDEAITDAAAVAIAANGPLAPIFRNLIEQRTDILGEVDSLAYEQDMGVSGWVGGRRTLIGNRRLMENHGVEMPSKEYEERYIKDDRAIVYLSTGGTLSAMFVVSYIAHPLIRAQMKALKKEHARLVIRTCDPNVTAARVAEVMGVDPYDVQVLTAGQGRAYGRALEDDHSNADAVLACGGRAESKLFGAVQCRRLRRGGKAAVCSQLIPSVLMLAFCVFVTAVTGLIPNVYGMFGLMLGYGVLAWGLPKLFRS